jgi:hypothetical protein
MLAGCYWLDRPIGTGRTGQVWATPDARLGRDVGDQRGPAHQAPDAYRREAKGVGFLRGFGCRCPASFPPSASR